jgi:hypothetical protein
MKSLIAALALALLAGCALAPGGARSTGSSYTHRFGLPPEQAAACFARNAEEHSSALVSTVRRVGDGRFEVTVNVKNGVLYAQAQIERAGSASTGSILLMVVTSDSRSDLLDALTAGC